MARKRPAATGALMLRERMKISRADGSRARALARPLDWLDHEVLLGRLPVAARRLGILLLLGPLACEIGWLLAFPANPFTETFWVVMVLTIGALFLESRLLGLRSYGFSINPISNSVELLGLLLLGPSFLPIYVVLSVCALIISRPHLPLYRQLVSGQIYFLCGALIVGWLMLWPAWSNLATEPFLVMAISASMLLDLGSTLLVNSMATRAAGEPMAWRASLREVASSWVSDFPAGAAVVLAAQSYAAWDAPGLLLLAAAIFTPVMLALAPDADRAWRLVSDAAIAQLRQSRYKERLEEALSSESELAYTDPVTGLGNRYRFERDLSALGGQSAPVVLIVGDIAGLKAVNDRRGHDVGDELIRAGAAGLRRALRANDRIYRFGGDEFAALIPAARPLEMEKILERIELEVRRATSSAPDLRGVRSWMRLGWASSDEGIEDLYTRADSGLLTRRQQERLLGMSVHA